MRCAAPAAAPLLQEPVTGALDQVRGGAVDMARIMRLPFVRIRVALPEDLFTGDVAHACAPLSPQPLRLNAQLRRDARLSHEPDSPLPARSSHQQDPPAA